MNLTPKQYEQLLDKPAIRRRNPDCGQGADTKLEQVNGNDSLAAPQAQGPDSSKFLVRVKSYRTRLLDEDNLAEKYHVDTCRYAGILPSDAPDQARIETTQQKVKTKAEERTEIRINPLNES